MGFLSFWKNVFPTSAPHYIPEFKGYSPHPVISISHNQCVNGSYTDEFPNYIPIAEETPEEYESRAGKMSQITCNSIPRTEWCRSQCVAWIYRYLLMLDVMDSQAAHEGNRYASNGLNLLIWPRSKYRQMFKTHADVLYDRVQEVKADLAHSERRKLENLQHQLYGGQRFYERPEKFDEQGTAYTYHWSNYNDAQQIQNPPLYSESKE
ncbi:hypothetical protein N431DRAFT_481439 [Stipitochalara longipes BDJ]|nr:hypothetical protein N431DRAFT_481439 [Stipitochalara longipes BDJ]